VAISKFYDGYIISYISNKLYIFDIEGELVFNKTIFTNQFDDIYFNILPHKIVNKHYYFLLGFIYSNSIYFYYFDFNLQNLNITIVAQRTNLKDYIYYKDSNTTMSYNIENKGLSCQFTLYNSQEVITCAYYIYINNGYFTITSFYINNNSIDIKINSKFYLVNGVECIKSAIGDKKEQAIFCIYNSTSHPICYIYYAYDEYIYYSDFDDYKCKKEYYALKIDFYKEKNDFIFSCINNEGGIFSIIYDEDL
jgi:hypothetical protein